MKRPEARWVDGPALAWGGTDQRRWTGLPLECEGWPGRWAGAAACSVLPLVKWFASGTLVRTSPLGTVASTPLEELTPSPPSTCLGTPGKLVVAGCSERSVSRLRGRRTPPDGCEQTFPGVCERALTFPPPFGCGPRLRERAWLDPDGGRSGGGATCRMEIVHHPSCNTDQGACRECEREAVWVTDTILPSGGVCPAWWKQTWHPNPGKEGADAETERVRKRRPDADGFSMSLRASPDLRCHYSDRDLSASADDRARKVVNYSSWRWSRGKPRWRLVVLLTCKSLVGSMYRGERPIEPPCSWFSPKFPSG